MISQTTGTIKIAKTVKKDTITPTSKLNAPRFIGYAIGGSNYTFKQNKKIGLEGGLAIVPNNANFTNFGMGIQYSLQYQSVGDRSKIETPNPPETSYIHACSIVSSDLGKAHPVGGSQ